MTGAARALALRILETVSRRRAFLGLAKNAGKTTALVAVLEALHALGTVAGTTSVGRDGEAFDALSGEPKPRFRLWPKQLVASARTTFDEAAPASRLLRRLSAETRFGAIELRRIEEEGAMEIIGPTTVSEAAEAAGALEDNGAGIVLVDGALGRRAFASARLADGIVLAVGMSAGRDLDAVLERARLAVELISLETPPSGRATRVHEGALTDAALASLPPARDDVVVADDFASIFLTPRTRRELAGRGVSLAVRRPARLLALTSNPYAPGGPPAGDPRLFDALAATFPGVAIYDVVSGRERAARDAAGTEERRPSATSAPGEPRRP